MASTSTRRQLLRDLGLGAAVLPFLGPLSSLIAADAMPRRKQRLVIMFSPNGVVPWNFWPDEEGETFTLKESLQPLQPYRDQTLIAKGVCNKVRGAGSAHMVGIGGLLTGTELSPGNLQGGSGPSAGWASGISIDQEIKQFLQSQSETRTRFGSLEFGVMVPERADVWTRMSYFDANKPATPVNDPYQMLRKFYGQLEDQKAVGSVLDAVQEDLQAIHARVSGHDRRILEEHTTFIRELEQELRQANADGAIGHTPPDLEPGVSAEDIPRISRMQIDLMVHGFAADFNRVATLQFSRATSPERLQWLGIDESHHELSHESDDNEKVQDQLTKINRWYCEQLAYLVKRLAETPEPAGSGTLLDNTLVVWTNELGKGNNHTRNDIPFVMVGGGLDFRMGRSVRFDKVHHNRLLLALAHGFGHEITEFGNPNFCGDGPLTGLS
jgi:hypothetical protein